MNALLLAILCAAPLQALVKLPSPAELVAADRGGDALELERVAARLGAARLERLATLGKHDERLAALHAIVLVEDGWARLPELARLIGDADGEVATAAAATARRIAEGMTPELRERDEVPADVPARAAQELMAQAQKGPTPLRIEAMSAAAALRGITRIDDKALAKLLGDSDPAIRRAAAEALAGAPAPSSDKALEETLARDPVAKVASAAAASLCRDVPLVAPAAKAPAPATLADQRVGHLGGPARQRLRALAVDEGLPLEDRLDLVPCLRVNKKNEDQQTLDQLARKPPESLRRRARALGGR